MTEEELIWKEEVTEYLGDFWYLKGRPDLFQDVVDHVVKAYPVYDANFNYAEQILSEAFAFLQTHCTSAYSSKDLEFMAVAEKERLLTMT